MSTRQVYACRQCTKKFVSSPSQTAGFCSRKCYHDSTKGKPSHRKGVKMPGFRNSGSFTKGIVPWNVGMRKTRHCLKCATEFSLADKDSRFCSKGCASSYRQVGLKKPLSSRQKMAMTRQGVSVFTGFKTPVMKALRRTLEYRQWRTAVFARDNYTCQSCHIVGGFLEAHHIKAFAKFPEQRHDINNGVTLCRECHILADDHRKGQKRTVTK